MEISKNYDIYIQSSNFFNIFPICLANLQKEYKKGMWEMDKRLCHMAFARRTRIITSRTVFIINFIICRFRSARALQGNIEFIYLRKEFFEVNYFSFLFLFFSLFYLRLVALGLVAHLPEIENI